MLVHCGNLVTVMLYSRGIWVTRVIRCPEHMPVIQVAHVNASTRQREVRDAAFLSYCGYNSKRNEA